MRPICSHLHTHFYNFIAAPVLLLCLSVFTWYFIAYLSVV